MTAAATEARPAGTSTDDDDLTHVVCECGILADGRFIALCGKDVTGEPDQGVYTGPEPDTCIVCADLNEIHESSETCP